MSTITTNSITQGTTITNTITQTVTLGSAPYFSPLTITPTGAIERPPPARLPSTFRPA
jgi:hypothetical protein